MNYTKTFVHFSTIIIALGSYAAPTLKDSYERALETNFRDKINQTIRHQNIELKNQYRGGYLPKISAKGAYLKQENLTDQKSIGFNLTHSLFKGSRDSLIIDRTDKNITLAAAIYSLVSPTIRHKEHHE